MSDPTPPAPPEPALPGPAEALKALAAAIEAGDPPEMEDVRAALAGFRAAKLEKRAQQQVIEAREDARQGRIPDPLLLRLIARSLETVDPAVVAPVLVDPAVIAASRAQGTAASAARAALKKVEREVSPGVKVTTVTRETSVDPAVVAAGVIASVEKEIARQLELPETAAPAETWDDEAGSDMFHAEPPLSYDEQADVVAEMVAADAAKQAREQSVTVVVDVLRSQADRAADSLTDKEREALSSRFPRPNGGVTHLQRAGQLASDETYEMVDGATLGPDLIGQPLYDRLHPTLGRGNGGAVDNFKRAGNGGASPHIGPSLDEWLEEDGLTGAVDAIRADRQARWVQGRAFGWNPPSIAGEPDYPEPTETPAELVALAADLIEHLEMPRHADLVGELYALAGKLEDVDLDNSRGTLLDRLEREIERRIERAIKSPADLPEWMVRWAQEARMQEDGRRRFEQSMEMSRGVGVEEKG